MATTSTGRHWWTWMESMEIHGKKEIWPMAKSDYRATALYGSVPFTFLALQKTRGLWSIILDGLNWCLSS